MKTNMISIPLNYSDTLHKVIFVIGSCNDDAYKIFKKLEDQYPQDRPTSVNLLDSLIVVYIPVQAIPEIVKSLSESNIAVYQIITPELVQS